LVLLSVIMVGQNVQAAAADKRAEATFHDASAALHELAHVQGHLAAQDVLLTKIAEKLELDPVPVIDTPPDDTIRPGDETWTDDEPPGQDALPYDARVMPAPAASADGPDPDRGVLGSRERWTTPSRSARTASWSTASLSRAAKAVTVWSAL
jgi:hypothetical protein